MAYEPSVPTSPTYGKGNVLFSGSPGQVPKLFAQTSSHCSAHSPDICLNPPTPTPQPLPMFHVHPLALFLHGRPTARSNGSRKN